MANSPRINKFFDNIPLISVLLSHDSDLKILKTNTEFQRVFQPSSNDEIGSLSFLEFIPGEDQQDFMKFIDKIRTSEQDHRWECFTITDKLHLSKNILFKSINQVEDIITSDQILLVGLPIDDINFENFSFPNVQKEMTLEYQANKYQGIIENANVGIAIFNERGYLEETNPTFAEHIGQQREDFIGQHFCNLLLGNAKRELGLLFRQIDRGDRDLIKEVLRLNLDEKNIKILELTISKVLDNINAQNRYLLISQDITNQQETHAALIESEKLALTGRLAASLAHEINNPLQTSIGCLGLAEEILDEKDTNLSVYLNLAMQELQRSSRIVKKLRDLNRRADPSEKSIINLQEILEGLLLLIQNRMDDRNIKATIENEAQFIRVIASKDQIHQVFLNLLMNAIDAMPEGGKIVLSLTNTENPAGITVIIRDTGPGMAPEVISNLFGPFFTTKEDGMGLGLYICKQIIEDHEGKLDVESQLGEGTAFSVWLPQNSNLELESE